MSFEKLDPARNAFMLDGSFARQGYDWWWHSFTAVREDTGEAVPFFIDFFLCNPALGGAEPVFGQLPENQKNGVRPSYLMVKAGRWGDGKCQVHRFFGWQSVQLHADAPFSVAADDCYVSDTELRGSVNVTDAENHPEWMCGNGSLQWDLKIEKKLAYNVGYGASRFFRRIKAFEMYWHAEGMKSLYSGSITCNGIRYRVTPETSFGYADKNWGSGFTSPWVWLASSHLTSNLTGKALTNSAFDIGGGRPKIYFLPLNRKLLGGIYYEGTPYEFNFSKFWMLPRTKFLGEETDTEILWHVRQESTQAVLETEIRCRKADMIHVNYEAPDGSKRHNRLWNGGSGIGQLKLYKKEHGRLVLVDDIRAENIGCEYGEYDR